MAHRTHVTVAARNVVTLGQQLTCTPKPLSEWCHWSLIAYQVVDL